MVGYHTRAGLTGVLDHTLSAAVVYDLRLNGRQVGEVGLNAAVAGHMGVPVTLVSGDDRLAGEVEEILPWAERVVVKEAIGRHASAAMHPQRSREAIEEGMKRALGRRSEMRLFELTSPVKADLTFKYSSMADAASRIPGVERLSDITIRITGADAAQVYPVIMAVIHLGGMTVQPL